MYILSKFCCIISSPTKVHKKNLIEIYIAKGVIRGKAFGGRGHQVTCMLYHLCVNPPNIDRVKHCSELFPCVCILYPNELESNSVSKYLGW